MYFTALDSRLTALADRTQTCLRSAYSKKTWISYKNMFLTFLAFCVWANVDVAHVSVNMVLMFVKFLHENGLKIATIRNYISAIVTYAKWLGLDTQSFLHFKIPLMFKALQKMVVDIPKFKGIFQVTELRDIIKTCEKFEHPLQFKAIYLMAFFGFFRISNLVPSATTQFDLKKHLARADVLESSDGLVVILKWSKTIQSTNQGTYVILPRLSNPFLCPTHNFLQYSRTYPLPSTSPCFARPVNVTESILRKHLAKILIHLNLDPCLYSFHTFRRSGATLAYNLDVDLEKIMRHGTWRSQAVNNYIINDPGVASEVSSRFKDFFDAQ